MLAIARMRVPIRGKIFVLEEVIVGREAEVASRMYWMTRTSEQGTVMHYETAR
jgi:hypothetical protein